MIVNGKEVVFTNAMPLPALLKEMGYDTSRPLAVERNGQIVKKVDFPYTIIELDDRLEIMCFVGGG